MTDLASTPMTIVVIIVVSVVELIRLPNRWIPPFLITVVVGEVVIVNTVEQLLHRVRPTFNPIATHLGPSFPSGHSATAAALYAAVALVLARRRAPRTRALLAGVAVAIAVAVAISRVMLGVHWLSDVIAGLAFGWAWFAVCAIGFGGRFLQFGAPVEKAAHAAEHAESVPYRIANSTGLPSGVSCRDHGDRLGTIATLQSEGCDTASRLFRPNKPLVPTDSCFRCREEVGLRGLRPLLSSHLSEVFRVFAVTRCGARARCGA